jgi:hypothetical protein
VLLDPAGGRAAGRRRFVGVGVGRDEIAEDQAERRDRRRSRALTKLPVQVDRIVELAIDVAGHVREQRRRRLLAGQDHAPRAGAAGQPDQEGIDVLPLVDDVAGPVQVLRRLASVRCQSDGIGSSSI